MSAASAEVDAHDLSGHWSGVLGDVDGGFALFAEIATRRFFRRMAVHAFAMLT